MLPAPRRLVAPLLAIGALTIVVAEVTALGADLSRGLEVFPYLFGRFEGVGGSLLVVAALVVVVVAADRSRIGAVATRAAAAVAGRPALVAVGSATVLALAAVLVYRAYPLSADEYLPQFQARLFARGRLAASWPPVLLPWLLPVAAARTFYIVSASGQVISAYWPGFALLMTPFVAAGTPWLLNPLLAAGSLLLVRHLSARVWGEPVAGGWAMLLALASPLFVVNAFSFYSMNAHLFANLLFAALLLRERPRGDLGAGLIGSLALVLHNPLPHACFAAPWLVALAMERRWRRLGMLLAGYVPGLLLVLAWYLYSARLGGGEAAMAVDLGGALRTMRRLGGATFALPGRAVLTTRLLEYLELFTWSAPALPLLAGHAPRVRAADPRARRLLLASLLLTLGVYFFFPRDQGHGWGYRHVCYAWGGLPILAAGVVVQRDAQRLRWPAVAGAMVLVGLLASVPYRLFEVRRFIDEQRAQLPPSPPRSIVLLGLGANPYIEDLVRNDDLDGARPWVLLAQGHDLDRRLVAATLQDPRQRTVGLAAIWAGGQRYPAADAAAALAGVPAVRDRAREWRSRVDAPVARVDRAPGTAAAIRR